MKKFDRVKAVVSLDAIAHNFEEMKKNIAEGTKIVAVIKASLNWSASSGVAVAYPQIYS